MVVDPKILTPRIHQRCFEKAFPQPRSCPSTRAQRNEIPGKACIRFGETIKAYVADPKLDVKNLKLIPLVFAGWLRYLMAIDDELNSFTPSPDPRLQEAQAYVKDIKIGDKPSMDQLKGLLSDATIFGVDLLEVGLADLVLSYFTSLIEGKGAVRRTLQRYVH